MLFCAYSVISFFAIPLLSLCGSDFLYAGVPCVGFLLVYCMNAMESFQLYHGVHQCSTLYIVDWKKFHQMQKMFCFLPFTHSPTNLNNMSFTSQLLYTSLIFCIVYHTAFCLYSQSTKQLSYPSFHFFPIQCYVFLPSRCLWSAVLTGAGLEVALSEDGGDGGGIIQAVVIVWAEGWWIQNWANCCTGFSPATQNHHWYYQYQSLSLMTVETHCYLSLALFSNGARWAQCSLCWQYKGTTCISLLLVGACLEFNSPWYMSNVLF